MSELRVGDLAIIVRGHCPTHEEQVLGAIVDIDAVYVSGGRPLACSACCSVSRLSDSHVAIIYSTRVAGALPVSWLKKIEPLPEEEKTKEPEKMKA